jgi:hypothetical protein
VEEKMIGWVRFVNAEKDGGSIVVHVPHISHFEIPKKGPIIMVLAGLSERLAIEGKESDIATAIELAYKVGG